MKNVSKVILISALLAFPFVSSAQIDGSLVINSSFTTNTDSIFDVRLNNYHVLPNAISVLTIADSSASDVKSAMFLDKSGWVILTPYQSGPDVIARFMSDTGFDINGQRTISMRVNFKTPKNYIIAYSLQDQNGVTLTSAASPVTVTGSVLGQTTTPTSGQFTRPLKYGSRGADVRALQERLTVERVYTGPITGNFYAQTQAAVKKYQTLKGISPANGVVGPQTLSVLNQ